MSFLLLGLSQGYVVDQNDPAASDLNPGTPEKPWKTLAPACRQARAGDTVFVMEGSYPEKIVPANSGAEGKQIVFKAVPRRTVSIQGVDTAGSRYLRIEGFRISDADIGVRISSDHVEIVDNYFSGIRRYPIHPAKDVDAVVLAYNEIYHSQFGIVTTGSGWTVQSNEVRRLFWYGTLGDSDYSRPFGERHVLRYNFFHGSKQEEIGQAHVDCFQVFDNNDAIARHITIEENVGFDFHQAFMAEGKFRTGNVGHFAFRKNIFSGGMAAWGLCLEQVPHVTADHNTFADVHHGIGFRGKKAHDGVVRNNIFARMATSYWTEDTACSGDYNLTFAVEHPNRPGPKDLVNVDPRFVDANRRNFRLQKESPAIGAGEGGTVLGALEYPNVYYVDPRHPGASDDGFGYAGWPFKSAAAACRVARPGETILLRGGIYRECLSPDSSGVAIKAIPGEKVIVSGADEISGWRREGEEWWAPLAEAPKLLVVDGKTRTDFRYAGETKRITVRGMGDPRLHTFETVVRNHGVVATGKADMILQGIEVMNTLGSAVLGSVKH